MFFLILDQTMGQLKTIHKNMPEEVNPNDHTKIGQMASFMYVLSQTLNERNYEFLNYSRNYRKAVQLVEDYKQYL